MSLGYTLLGMCLDQHWEAVLCPAHCKESGDCCMASQAAEHQATTRHVLTCTLTTNIQLTTHWLSGVSLAWLLWHTYGPISWHVQCTQACCSSIKLIHNCTCHTVVSQPHPCGLAPPKCFGCHHAAAGEAGWSRQHVHILHCAQSTNQQPSAPMHHAISNLGCSGAHYSALQPPTLIHNC